MNININTQAPGYVAMLSNFNSLRSYIGPKIKLYVRLDDDKRKLWRQADPLLKEVLRLVRDINKADARAEEAGE